MNKKQRQQLENKIASVEETLQLLKHQESNLLEAMRFHSYDHHEKEMNKWVREIIIGCEYIVRLEESLKLLKETLPPRRKRGGKKKD
tara:strand:+ start:207 stop:467 length:261 start_codon:yes stop_codon:yes gene_type:complete